MYSTFLTASPGSVLFDRSNLLKRKDLCFSCLRLGLIRHRRSFLLARFNLSQAPRVRQGTPTAVSSSIDLSDAFDALLELDVYRHHSPLGQLRVVLINNCICNFDLTSAIRDHSSKVEMQITVCIHRFYLRAAISDCLLIGFIRATETLLPSSCDLGLPK
jgi:hypothetical protein